MPRISPSNATALFLGRHEPARAQQRRRVAADRQPGVARRQRRQRGVVLGIVAFAGVQRGGDGLARGADRGEHLDRAHRLERAVPAQMALQRHKDRPVPGRRRTGQHPRPQPAHEGRGDLTIHLGRIEGGAGDGKAPALGHRLDPPERVVIGPPQGQGARMQRTFHVKQRKVSRGRRHLLGGRPRPLERHPPAARLDRRLQHRHRRERPGPGGAQHRAVQIDAQGGHGSAVTRGGWAPPP
ncbi:hypothetical protein ACFHYO_06885 [Paracoccus panacisoli]|uniref:Uncharacterized protein n=1 Tax=Paracoccus panacisoli TaxID=1510163 RepID=A0ABV6T3J5_9RHOB